MKTSYFKIFAGTFSSIFSTYNVLKILRTSNNIKTLKQENSDLYEDVMQSIKIINESNENILESLNLLGEENLNLINCDI